MKWRLFAGKAFRGTWITNRSKSEPSSRTSRDANHW
jgi:hypothetical protein